MPIDPSKMAKIEAGLAKLTFDGPDATLSRWAEIESRAEQLLTLHGLKQQGWKFKFSNGKNQLGWCHYKRKTIAFSNYYTDIEWSEIEDTLLHEIAHALADAINPDAPSHGQLWRRVAREIGARPETCAPQDVQSAAKHKFFHECPSCKKRWYRYRRTNRRYHCWDCGGIEIKFYKIGGR